MAALEFLNVTLYVANTNPLKEFYCDGLGLPLDYEEPGRLAAMGPVGAHGIDEGDAAGGVRLYFVTDDVAAIVSAARAAGIAGTMSVEWRRRADVDDHGSCRPFRAGADKATVICAAIRRGAASAFLARFEQR